MSLTDAQKAARENKLTASRVGILMSGDAGKVLNLWKEIVGDPSFVPEDLSAVWPVALGSHTESLHLDWLEHQQGYQLSRRGEVVNHPELAWACSTLDAWSIPHSGPVECKHVGAFVKPEDIRSRTFAQLHWQKLCTRSSQGVLSVIFGANEPVQEVINLDPAYAAELMDRAKAFWHCVETLTPPVALAEAPAPIPVDQMREISMEESNSWAEHAALWLEHREAAKKFENSTKELKALVPSDVRKASGHRVVVSRAKNNSLTVRSAA